MKRFPIRADNSDARGKYLAGFIDENGRIVIAPAFEVAKPFSEELAAVKIDGKWGFIDEAGELVIAPAWEEVGSFADGRASVLLGRKAIPPTPPAFEGQETSYTTVLRCGFIDCAGAMQIGPAWIEPPVGVDECPAFRNGRARWTPFDEKLGPGSTQPYLIDVSGARVSGKALTRPGDAEKRVHGLLYVHFYARTISGDGPPPVMGYKNLAGKYVYLSQGIVEQKGEAWVREHYAGPANQSPLKKP